jgi:hypothetical protein
VKTHVSFRGSLLTRHPGTVVVDWINTVLEQYPKKAKNEDETKHSSKEMFVRLSQSGRDSRGSN